MALLWADGFDHYGGTAQFIASAQYVYTTNDSNEPLRIGNNAAYIRTGGYYWDASGMVYNNWYGGRLTGVNSATVGAGAAFLFLAPPGIDNFCLFMFTTQNKDTFQASARLHPDGSISLHTDKDGALLGQTAPGVIAWGAYAYVECKCFADPNNGAMELRVNSVQQLLLTGLNTDPHATGNINGIMIGTRNASNGPGTICTAISDFVIWDTTGANQNNFFGDIRCRTRYAVSNGANQDFANHGQPAAWQSISQVPAVPGTDYISGAAAANVSTFGLTPLPNNTGAIYGVMMHANLNKSDAGSCTIQSGIASGPATAFTDPIAVGTGAATYTKAFQTDPNTGNAFTLAAAQAMQAIVERVS